jgi:hypothetical protein
MLVGQFAFLGNSEYISNKTTPPTVYKKAKFISSTGKELEVNTNEPVNVPQFSQCMLTVEVNQLPKFTMINLLKYELLK